MDERELYEILVDNINDSTYKLATQICIDENGVSNMFIDNEILSIIRKELIPDFDKIKKSENAELHIHS